MSFFKRGITGVLLLSMVCGPLLSVAPARVHAQANAAFEVNPAVVTGVVNTSVQSGIQTTILNTLNGLAWVAAKTVIQSLTKSIVTWINSGFEGSPAFETNLGMGLRSLSDTVASRVFASLANSDAVQSPFLENIILGVGAAYYLSNSEERLQERLRYTLNQVSQNDRAFLAGDFSQGGFNAWFSATLNSQNNPIGAEFILGQELGRQVESAVSGRVQELAWGRGFLSWRGDCLLGGGGASGADVPLTPGKDDCLQYEIKTPGSVIETQLGIVEGSPLRQLELADSINEIVAALMSQMVTQVLGSTGLSGSTQPKPGGGKSVLDQATDPDQYQDNAASALSVQVAASIKDTTTYQTGWQKIKTAAEAAQQACGTQSPEEVTSTLAAANAALSKASSALASLQAIATVLAGNPSPAQLTAASDSYIALISSGDVPNAGEVASATTQSTGNNSLVAQMNAAAAECQ